MGIYRQGKRQAGERYGAWSKHHRRPSQHGHQNQKLTARGARQLLILVGRGRGPGGAEGLGATSERSQPRDTAPDRAALLSQLILLRFGRRYTPV